MNKLGEQDLHIPATLHTNPKFIKMGLKKSFFGSGGLYAEFSKLRTPSLGRQVPIYLPSDVELGVKSWKHAKRILRYSSLLCYSWMADNFE